MKREFTYRVGVGIEGWVREWHIVRAGSAQEAKYTAITKFLHPDKGYNYVEVNRLTKAQAAKYGV